MTPTPATRGRPRTVSRAMLQEAAFELFQANGYAGTTVDDIAQCAGVSRATFFNYFDAKSDVFWVDLDDSLDILRSALAAADETTPVMRTVRQALLAVGGSFGPAQVPWAITHQELIGGVDELQASAVTRLSRLVGVLSSEIGRRVRGAQGELLARSAASAAVGAAVAATVTWTQAGTTRGALTPYLDAAITPVCLAYQESIAALGTAAEDPAAR